MCDIYRKKINKYKIAFAAKLLVALKAISELTKTPCISVKMSFVV